MKMTKDEICLYFADNEKFAGVCLTGRVVLHFEQEYRELLWHDGDEKYYPNGVTDEDYCILEFVADEGSFYRYGGKGVLLLDEMNEFDEGKQFEDGYSRQKAEHRSL